MTQTPSFRRSRDLAKSNKFGHMQELTNDNYSESKLCSIFRIEYKAIEFSTIKKNQQFHSRPQYWNDNEAAPANGGFVNKANYTTTFSFPTLILFEFVVLYCQCMEYIF